MKKVKVIVAIGLMMSSAIVLAHTTANHQAPLSVAGNGGLAWFLQLFGF